MIAGSSTSLVGKYHGLFPVEAALAAIEIKRTLTAPELQDADQKARRIRAIPFSAGAEPWVVLPILFAFASDLWEDGKDEVARISQQCGNDGGGLMQICVVGRGHWCFRALWQKLHLKGTAGSAGFSHRAIRPFPKLPPRVRKVPNLRSSLSPHRRTDTDRRDDHPAAPTGGHDFTAAPWGLV